MGKKVDEKQTDDLFDELDSDLSGGEDDSQDSTREETGTGEEDSGKTETKESSRTGEKGEEAAEEGKEDGKEGDSDSADTDDSTDPSATQVDLLLKTLEDSADGSPADAIVKDLEVQEKDSEKDKEEKGEDGPPADDAKAPKEDTGLSSEDFEKIFESPDNFVGAVTNIVQGAMQAQLGGFLQKLPVLINNQVQHFTTAKEHLDGFYKAHPRLAEMKKFTAQVITKVGAAYPDKSYDEILNTSADLIYKKLGIDSKAVGGTPEGDGKSPGEKGPAFIGGKGGGRQSTGGSGKSQPSIADEIEDLLEI
jgi:hypothetical protein